MMLIGKVSSGLGNLFNFNTWGQQAIVANTQGQLDFLRKQKYAGFGGFLSKTRAFWTGTGAYARDRNDILDNSMSMLQNQTNKSGVNINGIVGILVVLAILAVLFLVVKRKIEFRRAIRNAANVGTQTEAPIVEVESVEAIPENGETYAVLSPSKNPSKLRRRKRGRRRR